MSECYRNILSTIYGHQLDIYGSWRWPYISNWWPYIDKCYWWLLMRVLVNKTILHWLHTRVGGGTRPNFGRDNQRAKAKVEPKNIRFFKRDKKMEILRKWVSKWSSGDLKYGQKDIGTSKTGLYGLTRVCLLCYTCMRDVPVDIYMYGYFGKK